MKAITTLIFIIAVGTGNMQGQAFSLYSNDTLSIESEYLRESIHLNLHLPETLPFSANTTQYPIIIIFDSQHERTYPQIINAFDLLTSETQIPESIIIGVPFNFQNRLYFTSNQIRENDSISGIERMERFLFSELIPTLQKKYKGNEYVGFIGHSRTAFLVNYLGFKRSSQINLAISLSGFFTDKPLSIQAFHSFLTDPSNFPSKFNYYYTAGTTLEESTYYLQLKSLDGLLENQALSENVNINFIENSNANHITNYWLSVPPILIDALSRYNSLLDHWFHDKLKRENVALSVENFQLDLEQTGKEIGTKLNPNLTHIYSLASHFAYRNEDIETAIKFIELGLAYYPDYLDFYVEMIEYNKVLGKNDRTNHYKSILQKKITNSTHFPIAQKVELLEYLDEK